MRLLLLLLLLLLLSGLLIVLIVGDVVLIAAVRSVRVGSVVLRILCAVVRRAACSRGRGCSLCSRSSRGGRRVLVLVASISTAVVSTILITVSALAVATVVLLGRVLLEALVLLSDISQKILTELLGILDLIRVRSTVIRSC